MNTEVIPMDRLAKIYIKIRTARQTATKEFETKDEELKAALAEVANAMKDQMIASGSKSTKTDYGTVIMGKKTRYFPSDWDGLKTFIMENNLIDLLEKRIAQQNMTKYLEDNPTVAPPGLSSETEVTIVVRRPT